MKVIIGADHAGVVAKDEVKNILDGLKIDYHDEGSFSEDELDYYPDIAQKVCSQVDLDNKIFGILICGSGTGMQIAANKINGIRAAFCFDKYGAEMSRKDNNCNVLCLRAREFEHSKYEEIVRIFLSTNFSEEARHVKRIEKIKSLE